MDDPRLSRMYLALLTRRMQALWQGVWMWCTLNFGFVILSTLVLLCAGLVVGWRAHERGRFARLKSQLKEGQRYQEPKSPQPGGQDIVVLQRTQISGGTMPEFLSATLLPGRGLDLLQITAYLPNKGEVQLLEAPTAAEAAAAKSGGGDATVAAARDVAVAGPVQLPWAGRVYGQRSQDGAATNLIWRGHALTLPSAGDESIGAPSSSAGGLLVDEASTAINANVMPDGGETQARFGPTNFGKRWMSQTEVSMTALLSRNVIELKVTARNTGSEDEPMGIGWAPRFRIISGDRSQATLKLPSTTRLERRSEPDGVPSGKFQAVAGTARDFTARAGTRLGAVALEDTFVDLHSALFDLGPVTELRDPRSNFGIRLTAMTPAIKAIHVSAPAGASYVSISDQTNLDDPLGREWGSEATPGITVLHPGESMQWNVRLEIFPLSS